MTSARLVALGAMLLLGGPALAQGTQAQRAACTPDAMRLCASHIPDVGAITSCLRSAGPRLSPACRSAMGGDVPAPAVAEARQVAPRAAEQRIAARREVPAKVAARVAAQPARVARPALVQRQAYGRRMAEARYDRRPTASRYRSEGRRYAEHRPRRQFAGLGLSGSEMAQARYWMRTLGGMGLDSAVAGYLPPEMSGISMEGIAGMLE